MNNAVRRIKLANIKTRNLLRLDWQNTPSAVAKHEQSGLYATKFWAIFALSTQSFH